MMLASLAGVSAPVARVRGRSGRCSARCGAARVAPVRCSAAQPVELSRSALLRGSAALGALVAAGAAAPPSRAAAAVGESAPAFSLPASTGGSISLADLTKSGKYTVLYFYVRLLQIARNRAVRADDQRCASAEPGKPRAAAPTHKRARADTHAARCHAHTDALTR
jgi:hypothetical protein